MTCDNDFDRVVAAHIICQQVGTLFFFMTCRIRKVILSLFLVSYTLVFPNYYAILIHIAKLPNCISMSLM